MPREVVRNVGAFTQTQRDQINRNFAELYSGVFDAAQLLYFFGFILNTDQSAAAGSNQATATPLGDQITSVSGATGTAGVRLPANPNGRIYLVYNEHATNGLLIYPDGTNTINGGTAGAAINIEGRTLAVLVGVSNTNWGAIFTVNT